MVFTKKELKVRNLIVKNAIRKNKLREVKKTIKDQKDYINQRKKDIGYAQRIIASNQIKLKKYSKVIK